MKVTPTIVNQMKGGLGNQMFQIASSYGFARDVGANYAINYDIYAAYSVISPHSYKQFYSKIPVTNIKPEYSWAEPTFAYTPIEYDESVLEQNNMKLLGYFQSPKYFDKYREEVKNLFTFPEINLSNIMDTNTVGVHIRRGDYVHYSEHDILTEEYFHRAIESVGEGNVIICTDDPEWVRKRFNYPVSSLSSDLEDLYFLSQCRRLIISNSSFSWWGAYLGVEKDTVIAPEEWFGDPGPYDYQDIYMEKWKKMPI